MEDPTYRGERFAVHVGDKVKHKFTYLEGVVKCLYGLGTRNVKVLWNNDTCTILPEWQLFVEVDDKFVSTEAL